MLFCFLEQKHHSQRKTRLPAPRATPSESALKHLDILFKKIVGRFSVTPRSTKLYSAQSTTNLQLSTWVICASIFKPVRNTRPKRFFYDEIERHPQKNDTTPLFIWSNAKRCFQVFLLRPVGHRDKRIQAEMQFYGKTAERLTPAGETGVDAKMEDCLQTSLGQIAAKLLDQAVTTDHAKYARDASALTYFLRHWSWYKCPCLSHFSWMLICVHFVEEGTMALRRRGFMLAQVA